MLKGEIFAEAMIQWSGPDLVGITRQRQLQLQRRLFDLTVMLLAGVETLARAAVAGPLDAVQ